jgi:hypothetical protein
MTEFLLGFYLAGVMVFFVFVGFFCILGGKESDLWKPVVWAIFWPILTVLWLLGLVRLP